MNSLNYSFYFNLTNNNIKILNLKFFPYAWWYPPSIHYFIPLIAAGDSISGKEISKRG